MLLNDAEIRMLTEEPNLARAARAVMELGPRIVVAKRGEYGAVAVHRRGLLRAARASCSRTSATRPARATASPAASSATSTCRGREQPSDAALRRAMAYGTVLASFNVEEFGTERVARLTEAEIAERYDELRAMTHFELPGRR